MAVATPGAADYRPPRWFLIAAACVVALLYAAAMTAINLLPFGRGWNPFPVSPTMFAYEHGWPLVYMVRDAEPEAIPLIPRVLLACGHFIIPRYFSSGRGCSSSTSSAAAS